MRDITYTVFVAATILLSAACAAAQDRSQPLMRIYFMPFAVQTYAPVTKGDIEEVSPFRVLLGRPANLSPFQPDHVLIAKLPAMLRAHPASQPLQDDFIRLKVVAGSITYYGDNKGVVLEHSTGRTFQLTKDEMEDIHRQITGLRGVVDIDVHTGLSCRTSK